MIKYIIKRILYMIPTVFFISFIVFIIIQLPPGSWVDSYVAQLQQDGEYINREQIAAIEARYGLKDPIYVAYFKWIKGWPRLDFGRSYLWRMPVIDIIKDQLLFSVVIAFTSLVFTYLMAIPIALYSAVHQYSWGDNFATFTGFIGLSIPNFILAFILMYVFYKAFGFSPGGLISPEFQEAPWNFAKFVDFIKHLWVPMIVLGTSGTAGIIRVLRATLLDELDKDYIKVARAKGIPERKVITRHALRIAISPIISNVIRVLPNLISGATITAAVLSLPILGGVLLSSLRYQDMYVAGTIIFFQSMLVVIGALISDIVLVIVDPRIRYK